MKVSKKLINAYTQTDFVFYPNNGVSILTVGKKNRDVDNLLSTLGGKEAAFITPWNPGSKVFTFSENQKRMKSLINYLKRQRLTFIYGVGRSKDGKFFEDSVLILDIPINKSLKIGKRYGQNAIVFYQLNSKAELLFCL